MARRLLPEGNLGAVHPIDARIAAGRLMRRLHQDSGDEAQLHQPVCEGFGQLQVVQNGGLALA